MKKVAPQKDKIFEFRDIFAKFLESSLGLSIHQ